ncbi:hypothetical protein [Massilia timonae]|uniref:hypothetical protein n=1 Tax=Massilia timonae TaxID=47229 RepID=UPI0028978D9B|nr:hypothetical protein [Massilia timonae]
MNEYQQAGYPQQFGPQQFAPQSLGSMFGAPLGGLFNNSGLGGRIGETAGGFLGRFSPLSADPSGGLGAQLDPQQLQELQQLQQLQQMQQMQQQQGQLTPQGGFFGNLISTIGKPAGSLIGNLTGNRTLGNIISEGSSFGRYVPFGADAQGQQQGQQASSPLVQLQQLQVLQQQLQQTLQQVQQQQAVLQQQVAQQGGQQGGQIAPQGWLSNAITQYARPVGGFIGEQLGNQGLGAAIGNVASQLGRYVPLGVDPYSQQQFGQQQFGQQPLGQQFGGQQMPYGGQQMPYGGQQTVH